MRTGKPRPTHRQAIHPLATVAMIRLGAFLFCAAGIAAANAFGVPPQSQALAASPTQESAEQPSRANRIRKALISGQPDHVFVVAHRGDWRNAPENSVRAIQNAIGLGVDLVEVDVRRTSDGHFVLLHDTTLNRTTTGSGPVSASTLSKIKQLRLRNGQGKATRHRVPTLQEGLAAAKGDALLVLDKADAHLEEILALLERAGKLDSVVIGLGIEAPEASTVLARYSDQTLFMPYISLGDESAITRIAEYEASLPPVAYTLVFEDEESLSEDLVRDLQQRGRLVWLNSLWPHHSGGHDDDLAVDDPDAAYGWLVQRGARMIQSDRPALLLDYLHRHGHRSLDGDAPTGVVPNADVLTDSAPKGETASRFGHAGSIQTTIDRGARR